MKNKLKKIIASFAGLIFLGALSGCSCACSANNYLDGQMLGKADDTSSTFYQVRKYYCEQFVYDFNKSLVNEGQPYAALSNDYSNKFVVDGTTIRIAAEGEYGHYLFTYYGAESFNGTTVVESYTSAVDSYVEATYASQPEKITLYKELLVLQAWGSKEATEATRLEYKNGYFAKVANTKYDEDKQDNCTAVKDALSKHAKAGLVYGDPLIDPATGITLPHTTWKDAWGIGLLYGLFVYPIGWLINFFVEAFGGTGVSQIFAIFVVTFILKLLIFLVTFKSQSSTQKMQDIQPELLKLQAKYGQNPTQEERQKMSMEMMALYKKYGVKPLAPFASMLITFPVFIAMYRAVIYLAVLRTGSVAGVTLGENLSIYILNNFNWFAFVIFLIMAGSQIVSMKLPTFLNRKRMTKEAKEQQKQANTMTNVMMIMILVMGFFMPVVMSIYWIASAIVAVLQQLLMHYVNNANKNKKGTFKPKKAEDAPITIPQGYKK